MDVRRILLVVILVLGFSNARSQTMSYIQGIVTDSSGTRLLGATIRIWNAQDSIQTLSNSDGSFIITMSFEPSFIQVTMKGYKTYHNYLSIPYGVRHYSLPPIVLQTEYLELQPITVHMVIPITYKKDTIEYHATAYSMREGALLADLMQKLPGITVNKDSSVTVMGTIISKVMVDGKPFFGKDIKTALQTLPYDIIDKVEIIDDYGDQARLTGVKTGEPDKVLNIELKKDKRNGQLGILQGGFGTYDEYIFNIVANAFSGERQLSFGGTATNNNSFGTAPTQLVSVSYADRFGDAWTGSGDGHLSADHHRFLNRSLQDYHIAGDMTHQEQYNTNQGSKQQQQLNYEWHYGPVKSRELRLITSISNEQSSETNAVNTTSAELDSAFSKTTKAISLNQANIRSLTGESKIYLAQAVPHIGHRISLDADLKYIFNQLSGDNLTHSQIKTDNIVDSSLQHYKLKNTTSGVDLGGGLHYYIPLGTGDLLECGDVFHYTLTRNYRNWMQPDTSGKNWNPIDSLRNDYSLKIIEQDFKIGYTRHSEKMDLALAILAEPGNLEGTSPVGPNRHPYHYFNLTPKGSINYSLNKTEKIMMDYSTAISPPTLQQLQPITSLDNPQYPVTGNPNLKPALIQSVTLDYEKNCLEQTQYSGFGFAVSYSNTQNEVIANVVQAHDTTSVIQTTFFENATGARSFTLNWRFDLPLWLQGRLKISGSGSLSENEDFSMADYILYSTRMLTTGHNINIRYAIPDVLMLTGYIFYNYSITRNGINSNNSTSATSITWGINNRQLLLRNWTLSYEFMEPFNGVNGHLTTNPLILNIQLQRYAFKHNRATCSLSIDNLFNANSAVNQSVTNTTTTQNTANFVGRRLSINVQWNFQRFSKMK